MRQTLFFPMLVFVGLMTACVTINIYFPAAAAEKVADEIIEDIQGDRDQRNEIEEPRSHYSPSLLWLKISVRTVVGAMISNAHAEQANLSIDTPAIRKIRAAMKTRFSSLEPFYTSGYIGIQSDGYIGLRDPRSVPLKDRSAVKKLVANENTDRAALYQAIANANGHPEWLTNIQSTFASRWVSNARAGWWYQTPNGAWAQR